MNRRQLMQLFAAHFGTVLFSGVGAYAAKSITGKKGKILIPTGSGQKSLQGNRFPNYFHTFDIDNGKHSYYEIPLALSHSTFRYSGDQFVVLEKDGPKACIIDINSGKVVGKFSATGSCVFSGHGLIDSQTKSLMTTEFDYHKNINKVVIRDLANLDKIKSEITDVGVRPHEMAFFGSPHQIALGHYGYISYDKKKNISGEITLVDLQKGKTVRSLTPKGTWYSPCHITKVTEDSFIAATHSMVLKDINKRKEAGDMMYNYKSRLVSKSPLKYFNVVDSPMLYFKEGQDPVEVKAKGVDLRWTVGMAFSPEKSHLVATSTFSRHLSLWDTKSGKNLKVIKLEGKPSGVFQSLDKKEWIVVDHTSRVYGIDVNNFKTNWSTQVKAPKFGVSPHIYIV